MDLFELLGKVAIDNADANKALDETSAQGEKTQSKMSKAFSTVGKSAAVVGKTIMTGLAVGGTAMAGLTVKALNLSGELEQNMGGSEQVFAEYAGKMQDTAKNAFSNMGLSTSEFLGTANKMGALFQGAGFSIAESSDLSASAMQRAADVASIMGIDTSAAMEAIAGAAKGNFTMMDNLGVAMNDTTLQAYALSKGIDKSTSEMTNQEKIGLAMEMFMEKTAYAAGNYAKENQTLAGSLGTAKAALTNFLDGSGDVDSLVSAFSNAATVIVDNVTKIAPRLVTGITEVIGKIIPLLPPLLQQLLPAIIDGAVSLINGLVSALPMIMDAIMGALPALIDGIVQIMDAVIAALPQLVQSLVSALPALIPQLVDGLVQLIVSLCTMLPQIIQPIIEYLPDIIIAIVDAIMQNLPILIDGVVQLILGILEMFPMISEMVIQALPALLESIVQGLIAAFPAVWEGIKQLATTYWDMLKAYYNELFTTVGEWLSPLVEAITGFFSDLWDDICNVVDTAIQFIGSLLDAAFQIITLPFRFIWENCKDTIIEVWNTIKDTVSKAINTVKDTITNVFNAVKNFITPIWNGIKTTITNVWNGIKTTTSNVVNGIKNTVSNVFNSVKSTIGNIFNGIKTTTTNTWNGVKDAITKPIEKAKDLIKGIVDKIKGFFSGMNISFPKIKMPHFSIKPSGWKIGDLLEGSIPKLGIEWYAKGGIMKEPTLFDYNPATGRAKVGGEAGDEAIAPISTLQQYVRAAVQSETAAVAEKLERIINLLVQFFPDALKAMDQTLVLDTGILVAETAPMMDTELGKIAIKKGRGR